MKRVVLSAVMGVVALTTGCASITKGSSQGVNLTTSHQGESVEANCQVRNDKFTAVVRTPGVFTASRSTNDITVECSEKKLGLKGSKTVPSATGSNVYGNIIFGGVVGAGVDIASGAAFDYPSNINVELYASDISKAKVEQK